MQLWAFLVLSCVHHYLWTITMQLIEIKTRLQILRACFFQGQGVATNQDLMELLSVQSEGGGFFCFNKKFPNFLFCMNSTIPPKQKLTTLFLPALLITKVGIGKPNQTPSLCLGTAHFVRGGRLVVLALRPRLLNI